MGPAIRSSILAALLCAFACTPRGSDSELSTQPELGEPAAVSEPVPGFVIYTEDQTVIVPLDGSPLTVGEGLWLQDDRVSPPAISHTLLMTPTRAAIMDLPRCPCLALAGACEDDSVESRRFAATGALIEQPAQACTCLRRAEAPAFAAAPEPELVTSLVGGWLLYQGHGSARGHALIEAPAKLSSAAMRSIGCRALALPDAGERSWPIAHDALTRDCELEDYESQVFLLRRGQLWEVRDSVAASGSTRAYLQRPARPDSCPSSNDPCGDPAPFRARAQLDRRQREYWIATDGSAALTAERHSYALWRADANSSVELELPNIDASADVIGVRVHADLGPLRALIEEHPTIGADRPERAPTTISADVCLAHVRATEPGYQARAHGNDCFSYVGLEQWTDAEASCLAALALAEQSGTRGAILYNLGLIAEAEGALAQAGVYYRESLAVRPSNRTAALKLARLEHHQCGHRARAAERAREHAACTAASRSRYDRETAQSSAD